MPARERGETREMKEKRKKKRERSASLDGTSEVFTRPSGNASGALLVLPLRRVFPSPRAGTPAGTTAAASGAEAVGMAAGNRAVLVAQGGAEGSLPVRSRLPPEVTWLHLFEQQGAQYSHDYVTRMDQAVI